MSGTSTGNIYQPVSCAPSEWLLVLRVLYVRNHMHLFSELRMKFHLAELSGECCWAQTLHIQNLCRTHMVTQLTGSLDSTEAQLPTMLAIRVNGRKRMLESPCYLAPWCYVHIQASQRGLFKMLPSRNKEVLDCSDSNRSMSCRSHEHSHHIITC